MRAELPSQTDAMSPTMITPFTHTPSLQLFHIAYIWSKIYLFRSVPKKNLLNIRMKHLAMEYYFKNNEMSRYRIIKYLKIRGKFLT